MRSATDLPQHSLPTSDEGGIGIKLWERIVPIFFWLLLLSGGTGLTITVISFFQLWSQGWMMLITIVSCLFILSGLLGLMAFGNFLRDTSQPKNRSNLVKH